MKKITLLLIFLISINYSFAQVAGGKLDQKSLIEDEIQNQMNDQDMFSKDEFPVGNAVDPDFYYVGPGDMLTVQILPIIPVPMSLRVSPENTIIIPKFKEFKIKDMTLSDVKDSIIDYFLNINPNIQVAVHLNKARTVLVKIEGDVAFPTTYSLPSSYTVSTAILFANQIQRSGQVPVQQMPALLNLQKQQRETEKRFFNSGVSSDESYSSRNVVVLHNDGTKTDADIEKAISKNSNKYDPYVREGDVIIVPYEKENYDRISISGAINKPKVIAYKEGDRISDLLSFGRGFTKSVNLDNIYLVSSENNKRQKITFDSEGNLISEDFEIAPGSTLIVGMKSEKTIEHQGVVSVQGEVKSPGVYMIDKSNTTLSDIISQAGGFTDKAYLPLANIIRRETEKKNVIDPKQESYENFQYSDLIMEDTARFFLDMKYRKPFVATNFFSLFEENKKEYDVILKDGDVINVPENPGNVFVFGQVKNPGFVDFKPGMTMQYYIDKCGGLTQGADEDRASIIRGRNKVWVEGGDDVFVYAGDQVYVPSPPAYPPGFEIQKYNTYVYMVSGIIGVISVLISIFGK
jgi:protein involved in polysaccharide export with SLBB domain